VRRSLQTALPLAAVALTLAACGSEGGSETATTAAGCVRVAAPEVKTGQIMSRPTERLAAGSDWQAVVETNCGSFTIALDTRDSPRTTSSFAALARRGFYDDLTFHRIAPGFVIQGGDPLGNGTGGPGYDITEKPPRTARYVKGTVAMAKTATDPDGTSGSQFFVVTADDAELPPQYAVLGTVSSGLDVIETIEQQPLQENDPQGSEPVDPIVIESVTISEG
jgi:cyclophilin family peptidyl-prolyl cis-trans isomerase